MRDFVHRENIKHYKELLERTSDDIERRRILRLLAEEEAKDSAEPAPIKRSQVNT